MGSAPAPGCSTVLNYGFKRDLNKYIADHVRHSFPVQSLQDVISFNSAFGPGATTTSSESGCTIDPFGRCDPGH